MCDICSSLKSPQDVLPCGDEKTSKDSCLAIGCCWNETKLNNTQACHRARQHNGTCIKYPEDGICFKYLNISVPQYRNTPRFIDYSLGLNKTNEILAMFQNLITVVGTKDLTKSCLRSARTFLCQYILSPCLEDGSFIQICRRECDMYERQCPKTLQKLLGAAIVQIHSSKIDFAHISLPGDCQNLEYEEDLAKVGRHCHLTGLFNYSTLNVSTSSTTDSPPNGMAAIIAPVIVVITVLAVAFLLYRRRKNREEQAKLDSGTPSLKIRGLKWSIRDHINKMSADDQLKSMMPVNDVKKIKQFPVDRISYEKDLGEGQFGQVFQGRAVGLNEGEVDSDVIVAVKTLKKGSSPEAKSDFDQEACLMNYLCHSNIVRLLAVSAMEEPYYKLSQTTLIHMCIDIARGLEYLASYRLIHRDIAARNCLVADDLTIKIADFGMSRDIYSKSYYQIGRDTFLPVRWLSPEAILFGRYTVETDVYSYGVLLWEVFTFSMQPYYGYTNKEVLKLITKSIHLAKPEFCPNFVYQIMKKCWSEDPELRPHYDKIIDALNGAKSINDTPKSREQPESEMQPEYQNFISLAFDAKSSGRNDTHEYPLIKSAQPSNQPEALKKEGSSSSSQGGVNSGLDFDSEQVDVVERRPSNQSDTLNK
ncbi:high affinity nerve growth factor receptor-like isoform X1 [Paramuricea clavata]|uniref:High affinity nerve growth factor receptor-like isoform X1 n=1 Tax=Paramuricea clavata TaxID=317549 RepID=A0A6S7HRT9_PARCT|nr:high affinity nerve growth factor receptor-like isoform X1 [Paramuricea clavata]